MYVLLKKLKIFIQNIIIKNISLIFLAQSEVVNTTIEIVVSNDTTTLPLIDVAIQS